MDPETLAEARHDEVMDQYNQRINQLKREEFEKIEEDISDLFEDMNKLLAEYEDQHYTPAADLCDSIISIANDLRKRLRGEDA